MGNRSNKIGDGNEEANHREDSKNSVFGQLVQMLLAGEGVLLRARVGVYSNSTGENFL